MNNELLHSLVLSRIEGVGSILYKQLITAFGTAEAVLSSPKNKLLKVQGLGPKVVNAITNRVYDLKWAKTVLDKSVKENIRVIPFEHPDYPIRVKRLFDAPPILFVKGDGSLNPTSTVAIVGTRKPSEYGKNTTEKIVEGFKGKDVTVISGLAYGIDITAHKAALKNNIKTSAVLANSLENVYPAAHRQTAKDIVEQGCLISENPVGTKAVPSFFLARNRIIAGLADCLILVESAIKGGGMVTATMAFNYNKEVYAVPGLVGKSYSEGPNFLIQNNQAKLFTDTNELLETLNWTFKVEEKPKPTINLDNLSPEEALIVKVLIEKGQTHIDELAWEAKINLNRIGSILLQLEFQDIVKALPGKKFSLK